jgi:transcriptional regulator with XRE-family HTH domain
MRPASGTHNLRRLRDFLGLQQDEFSSVVHLSKSLLQKLEHEKRPLTRSVAENIAACTGISPEWLLSNDSSEPLIDSRGKRYTRAQYERAQFKRLDLSPAITPPLLVRTLLLQRYAEARDLFLRREMHRYLIKFLLDLKLLCARYELKADYLETVTAADLMNEERKRENPDNLYPSVIRDAEKCYKAIKLQAKRLEREDAKKAKRLSPFLSPEDLERMTQRIRESLYEEKQR